MTTSAQGRTKTVRWADPAPAAQRAAGMSGLEVLEALRAGELPPPPIAALVETRGVEFEQGRVRLACTPEECHTNNTGVVVHGGVVATLLDNAMWLALHSTMPAGAWATTTQMSVNYLRPILADGREVLCEGRVLHRGRRAATAEGDVLDRDGRALARATMACVVQGIE